MDYRDYYATLGVERTAAPADIKRAYRRLARKYHPDVSKEPDAEARFKEVAEAYEVLGDAERRAAYDEVDRARQRGEAAGRPWDQGFEFRGDGIDAHSDFFEALFGRAARASARPRGGRMRGEDHHARIAVPLEDLYRGARRTMTLRIPAADEHGHLRLVEHRIEVAIPSGVLPGQHLRLAGQGGAGLGDGPPGDLYLEIELEPQSRYRVEGRDVYFDLPLAPWEAALGGPVATRTPTGTIELTVPRGSTPGRKLRIAGKGLPGGASGAPPGHLYAVLTLAMPAAQSPESDAAWRELARVCAFDPRASTER